MTEILGDVRITGPGKFDVFDGESWIPNEDANRPFPIQMPQVLCNAFVDKVRGGSVPLWEVEVNGLAPHEHRRVYSIESKSDNLAAQEGIRRFVEEMEILRDVELTGQ